MELITRDYFKVNWGVNISTFRSVVRPCRHGRTAGKLNATISSYLLRFCIFKPSSKLPCNNESSQSIFLYHIQDVSRIAADLCCRLRLCSRKPPRRKSLHKSSRDPQLNRTPRALQRPAATVL